MSLWYNNWQAQSLPGRFHMRLLLVDDSHIDCSRSTNEVDCTTSPGQSSEIYYTFHYILDEARGWKELLIPFEESDDSLSPFWRTGWSGQVGNNQLGPHRLRGWRMELSIDSQDGDLNNQSSGVLLMDQLSCVSTDTEISPISAALEATDVASNRTFADWIKEDDDGTWHVRYYGDAALAQARTQVELTSDGVLGINYTVQKTEDWGGFIDFLHLARGHGYYNLFHADAISCSYDVPMAEKEAPARVHLRLKVSALKVTLIVKGISILQLQVPCVCSTLPLHPSRMQL